MRNASCCASATHVREANAWRDDCNLNNNSENRLGQARWQSAHEKNVCAVGVLITFSQQFWNAHAPRDEIVSLRWHQVFFLCAFPFKKKKTCACCEYFDTIDDVSGNLCLDFVTCSMKCKSTIAICVQELRNCNRTFTVLSVIMRISWASRMPCLWTMSLASWEISRYSCARSFEISLPSICPCLGNEEHPLTETELMNVFFCSSSSVHCSGSPCTRRSKQELCALSLLSRKRVSPCCFFPSMSGRIGFPRADSMYGCTGSSSVPVKLYERVTSVTCVGPVSNKKKVSEFFLCEFHNSYKSFWWHGVQQNNRKAAGLIKISILGPVRSLGQVCTLHQDLVFLNVCSAPIEVWNRATAPPTDACLPLRSRVPVIVWRSCMIDVSFPLKRNSKQRKRIWDQFLVRHCDLVLLWCIEFLRVGQHKIQCQPSLMHLITRPISSQNSRIVC